jgi:hypothetical protein
VQDGPQLAVLELGNGDGHVIGHDVEHDANVAVAQRASHLAKALLAAELGPDP